MEKRLRETGRFKHDMKAVGIERGDILLVHASFKSLGCAHSSPPDIISAMLDVLGAEGTLLMPALSYATVNAGNPVFDQRNTPSCVGALAECFRKGAGTVRSLHPTHSVCAAGNLAGQLVAGHHRDTTPCGPHSPFRKIRDAGGRILMLGCGFAPNTSMHAIEEEAEVPYLLKEAVEYRIIPETGPRFNMAVRRHNFTGFHSQRYDRLEPLLDGRVFARGRILSADGILIDSRGMWEKALEKLEEDPFFFVDAL